MRFKIMKIKCREGVMFPLYTMDCKDRNEILIDSFDTEEEAMSFAEEYHCECCDYPKKFTIGE